MSTNWALLGAFVAVGLASGVAGYLCGFRTGEWYGREEERDREYE